MLKVFLVEDEFSVRERMKKNIDWEANGFCLVGEAGDGELAYPMIEEVKPDIIITDIKMPFMDGLQLSKLVKGMMPKVKIIILSGYDEFDYAKEAIRIGITDYLLKPITAKKLLGSLSQVAELIKKEREQEAYYRKNQLERAEKEQMARKKFFYNMVASRLGVQSLIEEAKHLGIDLTAKMYNILLIKGTFKSASTKVYEENLLSLNENMHKWLNMRRDLIGFDRDTEGYALLLKGTSGEMEELEQEVIKLIREKLRAYPDFSYCIGVGYRANRLSEIAQSFDSANKALAYRYLLSDAQVIYYNALAQYKLTAEEEHLNEVDITQIDKKTIETFLRNGMKEQVVSFTTAYLKQIESGMGSYLFRQYVMMDIYFNVVAFAEQLGYESSTILTVCGDMAGLQSSLQTKEKVAKYLEQLLLAALSMREEVSGKKYKALIEEAKHYIQQNYNKESISLNLVAEYVNISPSHFSAVFSQETGQTFISYLTQIRMEKAKELLRCTSMKTLEIGYEVGYKDPHYFSHLFKKTQHCTPKEYRR